MFHIYRTMNWQNSFGFSLIEILTGLILLSLVLLGFDATAMIALRETKSAYDFSMASNQIVNLIERCQGLESIDYSTQLALWHQQNQTVLPNAREQVKMLNHQLAVTLFWGNHEGMCKTADKTSQGGCLHYLSPL